MFYNTTKFQDFFAKKWFCPENKTWDNCL
jgi:hypothetical protein